MVAKFPSRLTFPLEAIESPPFRALYEQVRPHGEEQVSAKTREITFFHPGTRGGRLDSLERLLVNAGMPYNLYCATEAGRDQLHYWRPGMASSASADNDPSVLFRNPKFILSVRRAFDELVHGQTVVAFGR